MTFDAIKEYGKRLEHFGLLLQNESTSLRYLIEAADACGMSLGFSMMPADAEMEELPDANGPE